MGSLLNSGSGNSIVLGKKKKETFMKMIEVPARLGIGIKKFRLVRVFENHKNLTDVNNHKTMKGGKKGKRL
jgi:hypothetical protein